MAILRTRLKKEIDSSAPDIRKKKRFHSKISGSLDTYGLDESEKYGRPFQIIENLPCSIELPQYKSLTHALSVRDSAVLYNSLLNSRRTWIRAEMFELYWSKQYINLKERERLVKEGINPDQIDQSAARDKMHKLCDCSMIAGPHYFPIRLFILKNDEIEKKWAELQEAKKKEKEGKKKLEAEEKKKRQEQKRQRQQLKKEERASKIFQASKEKEKYKQVKKHMKKDLTSKPASEQSVKTSNITNEVKSPHPANKAYNERKMIANLNIMAQKDSDLNSLMIKVAGGEANSKEVEEFKKFIEIARKMDPPLGFGPKVKENDLKEEIKKNNTNVLEDDNVAIREQDETHLTEKSDKYKVENDSTKPQLPPQSVRRKDDQPVSQIRYNNNLEEKSLQLTNFQQKYLFNAEIAFEYLENSNIRFLLPKKAIFEQLEDGETYLMSWIVVHNKKEIDKFKYKRLKELQKIEYNQDLSTNKLDISKNDNDNEINDDILLKYNVYQDDKCPIPLYTPMTVKLKNISKKFKPIIMNSVDSLQDVQQYMSMIINKGTKLSGYNLWFQLDAYDDKELAESLRLELKEYEQGFKSKRQKKQL